MRRLAFTAIAVLLVATGCGTGSGGDGDGRIRVVAAEASWGDLARELGGSEVDVRILVDSPSIDPHDYEPTSTDARAFAGARLAVVNGIGYDPWASKLLDANPVDGREVVEVGKVVGVSDDGNPHQWYAPDAVDAVASAITDALVELEPDRRDYFEERRRRLDEVVLADYHDRLDAIRADFAGTPIGATESLVEPLADALDLRVLTPRRFVTAVSEGLDPSAADKVTVDRQIDERAIEVLVYNPQNATPDVRHLVAAAEDAGIPIVEFTETPPRAGQSFVEWQVAQLDALRDALAESAGP
jgi:zinc/manganese transport system substrate-binding protein